MIKVNLEKQTDDSYNIVFGNADQCVSFIRKNNFSRCIIITDFNVEKLYGKQLLDKLRNSNIKADLISFKAGEASKNLDIYKRLIETVFSFGADRQSAIIALGGGIVGDVAGLVAGTYMRGISLIQIPTTLLSMADSSIGGKAAVDIKGGKNVCGLFKQPDAVFIDLMFLRTLPEEEFKNGLVEIIKCGIIKDAAFFEFLEKNIENLKDEKVLLKCIERSCEIKKEIVEKDEKEKSVRMILNFGHTIGHAIEAFNRYKIKHGECIAEGMLKEAEIAKNAGLLCDDDFIKIKNLIEKLKLPKPKYNAKIIDIIKSDKKNVDGKIRLALPVKIGTAVIAENIPLKEIEKAL